MACGDDISFWGEVVPNWLAAVGTIVAAFTAIALALLERRRAIKAEDERDALRTEVDSAVASRVAGRMERLPTEITEGVAWKRASPETWRVIVKNASTEVVTEVMASIVHADGGLTEYVGSWDVLLPEDTVEEDHQMHVEIYNEQPYVRLTFTDHAGRRWSRGDGGRLERIEG